MQLKLTICFWLATFSYSYAQIAFEPGYFIDNQGIKTECLIKNYEWKNNPDEIEYKLDASRPPSVAPISLVSTFEIINDAKYIRAEVQIDRSSDQISKLSTVRQSEFSEETLFLKVLVEGSASLYSYEDRNLTRFFYQTQEIPIQQLEYKRYSVNASSIGTNARFRHQLRTTVNCENSELKNVENLKYTTKSLIGYFVAYNECESEPFKNYIVRREFTSSFNVRIKTGIDYATLKLKHTINDTKYFDPVVSPRIGLEAEFILPFNRNKWSVVIEPTYQHYRTEEKVSSTVSTPYNRFFKVEYTSIELPFGIRHYFFLSEESKIFLNASVLLDFEFDSSIDIPGRGRMKTSSNNCFSFGAGYQYKRLGIEIRYSTARDLLNDYQSWQASYSKSSIILGYRLF